MSMSGDDLWCLVDVSALPKPGLAQATECDRTCFPSAGGNHLW